jgi:hypothetical protein
MQENLKDVGLLSVCVVLFLASVSRSASPSKDKETHLDHTPKLRHG